MIIDEEALQTRHALWKQSRNVVDSCAAPEDVHLEAAAPAIADGQI